jgi:serine/threonine-protein kinase RsbT
MAPELLSRNPVGSVAFAIDGPADTRRSAELAASLAELLGFPRADCAEIALVVAELASNVLQHASGGTIKLSRIEGSWHVGIQIESEDSGPGISDLEQAVTDGYSTADGLGLGLLNAPSPVPCEHPWTSTSLLVIHSDGLHPHWSWNEFSDVAGAAPDMLARRLLQSLGKMDDDATVVVARNSDS